MRRIGIHLSIAGGIYKALEKAQKLNVNTLQIFLKNSNKWESKPIPAKDIEKYHQVKSTMDIEVFGHTGYLVNLAGTGLNLKKSIKYLSDDLHRSELLGIKYIVVHPGSHKEKGMDWGIKKIAESLDKIFDQCKNDVSILLETTAGQGSSVGHTFEQLNNIIELSANSTRLGVCLDTCHIFTAGYDISQKKGADAMFREFKNEIGFDRLKLIHLNDSKKEHGSRVDRHEHIGQGMIGMDGFKALLNSSSIKKVPVVLETPKFNDDEADIMNLEKVKSIIS